MIEFIIVFLGGFLCGHYWSAMKPFLFKAKGDVEDLVKKEESKNK